MLALLLFFSTIVFAQEDLDLSSIQALEEKLPDYNRMGEIKDDNLFHPRAENTFRPPYKKTTLEKIQKSGTQLGAILAGIPIIRLEDNKQLYVTKFLYVRYFKQEDEHGFKYLINKDGKSTFRIDTRYVRPISEELVLYERPLKYTPAPLNKVKTEYDRKLMIIPEASVYLGFVTGDFMQDLFNDPEARKGFTSQFGMHLFTRWNLPVKVGAVVNYEKATYDLSGGGKINYNCISFGPQFKTKDFEFYDYLYRLQAQLRISPFARVQAEAALGNADFKFNSTDLLTSIEHPFKNGWGEFVIGAFFQAQWLNFKDQPEIVSLRASNKTNTSLGLSLSQVFD